MLDADNIHKETQQALTRWRLHSIPFSESATSLSPRQLSKVFTGRRTELKEVLACLNSPDGKRILVHGWYGIGKTAFILEVLDVLKRREKNVIATYISMPPKMDLASVAFVALARALPDDDWAQQQLNQMGLPTKREIYKVKHKIKGTVKAIESEIEQETLPVVKMENPVLSFEALLDRALSKYKRVIIAIDDLDKQDPARVRELLRDAQGMLKGRACFLLAGHPTGLTRDLITRELGLFDLPLELSHLDRELCYQLLANYLTSVRRHNFFRSLHISIKKKISGRFEIDYSDPGCVAPFTRETASLLAERSLGVPRYLNRLATFVLLKACQQNANQIDNTTLEFGFQYADQQLRSQTRLTAQDRYVLNLMLEKGSLSDATITLPELQSVNIREFSELVPILEKLKQLDMVRHCPLDRASEYELSPLISKKSW